MGFYSLCHGAGTGQQILMILLCIVSFFFRFSESSNFKFMVFPR